MNNKKRIYFGLDTQSWWTIVLMFFGIILVAIVILFYQRDLFTRCCTLLPFLALVFCEYQWIQDKLLNCKTSYLHEILIDNNEITIVNREHKKLHHTTHKLKEIQSFLYEIAVNKQKTVEHRIYINDIFVARRTYRGIKGRSSTQRDDFATDEILDLAKYIDCFEFKIEEPAEKLIMGLMGYKGEFSKNINKRIEKLRNTKS